MVKEKKQMSFLDHVEELRGRLIKCIISVFLFSIVAYFFSERLIDFLTKPIPEVYFMSPTEAFSIRIKISLIAGLIASLPVVFYHLWQFVVPGLLEREVKLVVPVVLFSTFFFLAGSVFCFFFILPLSIKVLLGFGTPKLKPMIKIGDYISFISYLTLAFGAVFELPLIFYFLGKLGIVSSQGLAKGRKFALVGILIVAAVITPTPDAFTQLMLAGPLYLLYEVSIVVVKIVEKKKRAQEQKSSEVESVG